jgi:hypothetical protein
MSDHCTIHILYKHNWCLYECNWRLQSDSPSFSVIVDNHLRSSHFYSTGHCIDELNVSGDNIGRTCLGFLIEQYLIPEGSCSHKYVFVASYIDKLNMFNRKAHIFQNRHAGHSVNYDGTIARVNASWGSITHWMRSPIPGKSCVVYNFFSEEWV